MHQGHQILSPPNCGLFAPAHSQQMCAPSPRKIFYCLVPEPGSIYVMDRANLDFEPLDTFNRMDTYFVAQPVQFNALSGVAQTYQLSGSDSKKTLVFVTNNT